MNISAIIDTSTAAATAESVRFIRAWFNHTSPWAVKRAGIRSGSFNILATIGACSAILSSGKRLVIDADEKLTAFLELERQVLTVTFYLESIHSDLCQWPMTRARGESFPVTDASRRDGKAFHRARRWNANCVSGTAKGDLRSGRIALTICLSFRQTRRR